MKPITCLSIFYVSIYCSCFAMGPSSSESVKLVNVGVILDTADAWIGKLCLSCIQMAHSDFYAIHSYYNTRLVLHVKDSKSELIAAASAALDLIKNEAVQAIIGPQDSMQTNLIIDVCNKARVPILSFSATSPSLASPQNPYFYRIAPNECAQAQAISALFQAFQWREVVPIYIQGMFSEEVISCITRALQEANIHVSYLAAIHHSPDDNQIVQELHKLTTLTTRVFIVHMSPMFGSRLFAMAKEIGMMSEGYVWILTSEMTNQLTSLNSSITDTMQGVLGLGAYFPKTKEFQHFQVGWKSKFQQENPTIIGPELNVYCLWAYDAVTALAMAVEKAGVKEFGFQNTGIYSSNTTDFETDLGVSLIGPKLRKSLSETRFRGLSGDFNLVDGEVNSSIFQIINVFGDGKKVVGFWTPENGLTRKVNSTKTNTDTGIYSTSKTNLGPIIWPGDSSFAPEGWDLLANRKKLRIGIPVKPGYELDELVSAHYDPVTNRINVSGYCIDVFKVVMDALPYHVPYEFIPFNPRDYENFSTGSFYDDLMREVYLGKFDAAVGDITIRAQRSLYVDFTIPFTENEATFIVPIEQKRKKDAWVFLKPLTWELWVTSVCFFVFIGFVVWLLERGVNKEEFRGCPSDQVGTSLWSSFSTLVFSQWQRIHSNLARFVVIIWVFVGLILTQSYTASLTTLLTVEQLRPTVTDVNQLIQSGDYIGHQHGSSIIEFLRKMGFDDTKLRVVRSIEESDHLLTLGSRNGGIAASFAETPYIKVMQSRYCSKYTTIGPSYQSQGFGFAFRRNSPFVTDVSRAILNLTEKNQDIMKAIVNKWFNNKSRCLQPSIVDASYILDLDSFHGLFLLSGIASSLALIIYAAAFLYKHWQELKQFHANDSLWKRICILLIILRQNDIRIRTGIQNYFYD
ncbi:hypothetical protein L6164_023535 [Bauhinia variegata]|uniref:Uncharacterized protein n=2 Tax=Bauhinia variegata TaxID=167791 RepID=A0ACB9MJ25_BAUVA|nr:hypothetical protein L6164_023525 [Bauhinia variegata]KAI4323965.1 hypothetical protein L6164_023535 [Bauhinia variegata]